jgi:predicted CXXCH cytochrome family protein
MKKIFALAVVLVASTAFAGVSNSRHNMNTFIGGTQDADVCYYCHAAHNTSTTVPAPLWARNAGTATTFYSSNSISVNISSLDAISGACMSCHDGSTDVGVTIKGDLAPATNNTLSGAVALSDLSNDHPVNLVWVSTKAGLGSAPLNAAFKLYGASGNLLTCGTCHAVHDSTIKDFLRVDPAATDFCASCHVNK